MKQLRAAVAATSRHLHAAGWCANHDGNVTARDGNRYIATPTATSKRVVGEKDLIEVDAKGAVIGSGKVFGEIGLHLVIYERRPDIGAVVHAHPPNATAIACARGNAIETPFIAEALVSLGAKIPKLAYAQPGEAARAALAPWCELVDAVLLGNHGVIAWGKDCETALLRMELVEHLAKIALVARQLGGVRPLPSSALPKLMESRAKAGLGAAPSTTKKVVVACAPAPPGSDVEVYDPKRAVLPSPAELASIIRQEIAAALKK